MLLILHNGGVILFLCHAKLIFVLILFLFLFFIWNICSNSYHLIVVAHGQLRDGSSHQGTVTSMEPNEGTFVLHSEKTKVICFPGNLIL